MQRKYRVTYRSVEGAKVSVDVVASTVREAERLAMRSDDYGYLLSVVPAERRAA